MKVEYKISIALMLTLSSCVGLIRARRLIDHKEKFIWTGSDGTIDYLLTVDHADGIWFTGKIIIGSKDTLYLKGFEKGSNHPTTVKQSAVDSINNTDLGHIFIWTKDYKADAVIINNKPDSIPQLPFQLILVKTKRTGKNDINKRH